MSSRMDLIKGTYLSLSVTLFSFLTSPFQGIAKKPVIAKIDPVLVQKDMHKYSERRERASKLHEQNPVSFGHSERYEPDQWPSNETVSLASGRKGNNERNVFNFSSPHYYNHRESSSPYQGKAYSFAREPRMPNGESFN